MNLKNSLASALAAIALVAACGTGGDSDGRAPASSPQSPRTSVTFQEPPWGFDCPSLESWRRSRSPKDTERTLLPCSRLILPVDVVDDRVSLRKGTPVVFLGVYWHPYLAQDYAVIAIPGGHDASHRLPGGTVIRHHCAPGSAHFSPNWKWGWVYAEFGQPPPSDPRVPAGAPRCR